MDALSRPPAPTLMGSSTSYSEGWQTFSPVVYRYLEQPYVDAFFQDGTLRLTSFAKCKNHTDEQRLDMEEGSLRLAVSDEASAIKAFYELECTDTAYLLCTTLWHNRQLMLESAVTPSSEFTIQPNLDGECHDMYQASAEVGWAPVCINIFA